MEHMYIKENKTKLNIMTKTRKTKSPEFVWGITYNTNLGLNHKKPIKFYKGRGGHYWADNKKESVDKFGVDVDGAQLSFVSKNKREVLAFMRGVELMREWNALDENFVIF